MKNAGKKLAALRDEWTGCERCRLHTLRSSPRICFGAGSYDADFLIVFDSPTAGDMVAGEPAMEEEMFDLLDALLDVAKIDRKRTFRASTVACRPYSVIPATEEEEERIRDRKPDKEEIDSCKPRLEETIYLVDPRIIITMGEVAWKALVTTKERGKANTIAQAQKKLYRTFVRGRTTELTYPVMATVSLQQMLANPSVATHGPTATAAEALSRAATYVNFLKQQETP